MDSHDRSARIASNTAANVVGTLAVRALDIVVIALLARYLDVHGFGLFAAVFAYVAVVSNLVDLGVNFILIREVSARPERASQLLGAAIPLRLLIAVVLIAVLNAVALVTHPTPGATYLVPIASLGLLFSTRMPSFVDVFRVSLISQMQMGKNALLEMLTRIVTLAALLAAIVAHSSLEVVVAVYVLSSLPAFVLFVRATRRMYAPHLALDTRLWRALLREGMPLALGGIAFQVLSQLDILLLARVRPESDVGLFSAARRLVEPLDLLPLSLVFSLLPVMSERRDLDPEADARLLTTGIRYLLVVLLPILLLLYTLAPFVIGLIFGDAFTPAVPTLRILLAYVPLLALWQLSTSRFIASRRQTAVSLLSIAALLANAVANLIVIPRYSYLGAAVVRAGTAGLLAVASLTLLRHHGVRIGRGVLVKGVVAVGVAWLAAWPVRGHAALAAATSLVVFVLTALLLGLVVRSDVTRVRALLEGRRR